MSLHKVEISGIKTNDIKVLKHEETIDLFNKYHNGDLQAREKLIEGNLRLVLNALKNFNHRGFNLDDLFQIGVVGLIKAIDNFDVSYGLKLSTYAVPLILGEIRRYMRDNSAVRVSRSVKAMAYAIMKFKDEYLMIKGHEPSNQEIAEKLKIEEYEIANSLNSLKDTVSIFEPIYNDGGDTIFLLDQLADKKEENRDQDMLISLRKSLNKIEERSREILVGRFIIGKTQTEMAEEIGISQAQVSRIEKTAMNMVKRLIK